MSLGRPLGEALGFPLGMPLGVTTFIPGTTLFSVLAPGSSETTECANANFSAVTGQLISCTGNAGRTMEKADGTVVVSSSNTPRVMLVNGQLAFLVESNTTNFCLRSSDLSLAPWSASNITAVKNATGPTGVVNSASTLTCNSNGGTILQSITLASASRSFTARLKRVSGTGTVEMTLNGGTAWVDVTASLTSLRYTRMTPQMYPGLNALITNPQVGFRMGTSGDVIEVAYCQVEAGGTSQANWTSDIETAGSSAARGNESITIANPLAGQDPLAKWFVSCTVTPSSNGTVWTHGGNKGVLTLGAFGAANCFGMLIPATARYQTTVTNAATENKTWSQSTVLVPSGTSSLVFALNSGTATHYVNGVRVTPAISAEASGIITTQPATNFLGSTSTSAALNGWISDIKIGIGNWPPRPL